MIPDKLERAVDDEIDVQGQVSFSVDDLIGFIPKKFSLLKQDSDRHQAELAQDRMQLLQLCQRVNQSLNGGLTLTDLRLRL